MNHGKVNALRYFTADVLFRAYGWFAEWRHNNQSRRGEVVQQGAAFGDLDADIDIAADRALGNFFREAFRRQELVGKIMIEGQEPVSYYDADSCVFIDPLDGSLNFARSDDGLGLPYTAMVTIYHQRWEDLTFNNVVVAGTVDLRSGDVLLAHATRKGPYKTEFRAGSASDFRPCQVREVDTLDIRSDIVIAENYYPDREWIARMFRGSEGEGEKGWVRNPGSAAFEMGLVARGQAVAFLSRHQKQHESPGGRALVLGAGGFVCDFNGQYLDARTVDFTRQDAIILAANPGIAMDLVRRANPR